MMEIDPSPESPRDITLQDLEQRNPEADRDLKRMNYHVVIPNDTNKSKISDTVKSAALNIAIGIIAGIALYWIAYMWPAVVAAG